MKKINILLVSNNIHKINEYISILPQNFIFHSLMDLNLNPIYVENGKNFEQNAKIKLNSLDLKKLKNIDYIISEDSGICVKSLNYEPGIYSKRYSNQGDKQNNLLLLQNLKNKSDREAFFIATIGCKNVKTGQIYFFEGKTFGHVAKNLNNEGDGFAYDFIFIPKGYEKTMSQLGKEIKNKLSHRKKAIDLLKNYLQIQMKNL